MAALDSSAWLNVYVPPASSSDPLSASSSAVAVTSGGLTLDLLYDADALAAPASFRAGIEQAAAMLTAAISDPITVNLNIHYRGTGGGAFAGPDAGLFESYSSISADLIDHTSLGDTIFNALPGGSSIQGQSLVAVWNAQLKALGFLGATAGTDDGSATFATDIDPDLLVGVALHELTHALGRVPFGPQPDIFDLFRFTAPDARLFQGGNIAPAAYFSVDGGFTKSADYGQASDPSDFLNSGVQGPSDPFNEFYSSNTLQQLTTVDLQQLDALGFHLTSNAPVVIEAFGSTSLLRAANNDYFLVPVGGSSGPSVKYAGAPVTAGQFDPWAPIGAEQTPDGYQIAWEMAGADQFTVWHTDSGGNYLWTDIGVVSGSSATLEALEPGFHQDLNNDGTIGLPTTTVIEASGSTSLVQDANTNSLVPVGGSSGPDLKYAGTPVVAGQFDPWTPIGAEQMAGGYEIAWKMTGADQFTVWHTDSGGNYLWTDIGVVSGSSATLEALEPSFQQDLNNDGTIGVPANGGSGAVDLALLTSHLAATFVPPAAEGAGPVAAAQPSDQAFLAKPAV